MQPNLMRLVNAAARFNLKVMIVIKSYVVVIVYRFSER